jgi:hypothetical protein
MIFLSVPMQTVSYIRAQAVAMAEVCLNVSAYACEPIHAIGIRIIRISKHPGSG